MRTIKRIPLLYPVFLVYQLVKYTSIIGLLTVCRLPNGAYRFVRYILGFWTCDCCKKTFWANREYSMSGYSEHKHCHHCCDPGYMD